MLVCAKLCVCMVIGTRRLYFGGGRAVSLTTQRNELVHGKCTPTMYGILL